MKRLKMRTIWWTTIQQSKSRTLRTQRTCRICSSKLINHETRTMYELLSLVTLIPASPPLWVSLPRAYLTTAEVQHEAKYSTFHMSKQTEEPPRLDKKSWALTQNYSKSQSSAKTRRRIKAGAMWLITPKNWLRS